MKSTNNEITYTVHHITFDNERVDILLKLSHNTIAYVYISSAR